MGFPGGSGVKNPHANAGDARDVGFIPGLGRIPGKGNGNTLQYCCLENSMDRGALFGYSPWGHKESDTTENTHTHTQPINLQQQCLLLSCLEGEAETWKPLDRMWWVNLTFGIQRGVFELRWWKASALAWDTNWKYFCRTLQSLQARFPFYLTFVKKQKFLLVVVIKLIWLDL